jgi:hypothetical protein
MSSLLYALRSEFGWRDEPFRARWSPLQSPSPATFVAFSPRGRFLAIGSEDGVARVWELNGVNRSLVCALSPPAGAVDSDAAPDVRAVATLAWSANGRVLFVASVHGLLVAHDVGAGAALRAWSLGPVLGAGVAPRRLRPHPTIVGAIAVVPSAGMPWLVDIFSGGGARQLSEALLPPPTSKKMRVALVRRGVTGAGRGSSALFCDAAWVPSGAGAGADLLVFTSRGDVTRLRVGDPSSGHWAVDGASGVIRVAYGITPQPIVPPELCVRGSHAMLTTRTGLCIFDAGAGVFAVDGAGAERYAETVDNTSLVSAHFGSGGRIFALPHEHSGHMSGGVYAFRRGIVGGIRLKKAPAESGGVVHFDVAPHARVLAGVGVRGAVFILQEPIVTRWPGPMYPPGFFLTTTNVECVCAVLFFLCAHFARLIPLLFPFSPDTSKRKTASI